MTINRSSTVFLYGNVEDLDRSRIKLAGLEFHELNTACSYRQFKPMPIGVYKRVNEGDRWWIIENLRGWYPNRMLGYIRSNSPHPIFI